MLSLCWSALYDLKLIADIVLIAERERSAGARPSRLEGRCVCLQGKGCGEFRGLGVAFGPSWSTHEDMWIQRGGRRDEALLAGREREEKKDAKEL